MGSLHGSPALRKAVQELSGTALLRGILELPNPRQVVEELAPTDFFWLVKKIGEEDSLPILELASTDQWQHLVDLEVWVKDRVQIQRAAAWLKRLHNADPERLAKWILEDGDLMARFFLGKLLEVRVRDHDTDEVPEGFFSLDDVYYVQVRDPEQHEWIQELLGEMARLDYGGYLRILLGLAEYLPSEAEEELYRLRNVRLAEQGFLPFEEALKVYAPLEPEAVLEGSPEVPLVLDLEDEERDLVPMIPLDQGHADGLLARAMERVEDPVLLDRIRLEFAGLANQIISAEGMPVMELEVMGEACKKAASYLNLGLEKLSSGDIRKAEQIVAGKALVSIFRVGFGMALQLQRMARKWIQGSWFRKMGLGLGFWGEPWGQMMEALLQRRPRYFSGAHEPGGYRDFQRISELDEASRVLGRLGALDRLMERLVGTYDLNPSLVANPESTFHPLLFNLWGKKILGLNPKMEPLSLEEAKELLRVLRAKDRKRPYRMSGFEQRFVEFFLAGAGEEDASILKQTLSLIWGEFRDEYERLPVEELDPRFAKFMAIE